MTNEVEAGAMLTSIPWPTPSDQDRAMAEEMTNLSFLAMDDETYFMMARAIAVGRSIMEARAIRAEEALKALVRKLDECEPHIGDAFMHRSLRRGDYTGPNYAVELANARAAVPSSTS